MDHAHAHTTMRRAIEQRDAVALVREYFQRPRGDRGGFTGAWFEHLGGGGDREDVQDGYTATDLVAVTMLSVSVPPRAAKVLLEEEPDRFSELLGRIPTGATILTDEGQAQLRDSNSPANELWRALDGLHGVGWVTAGKLLARKRPHLVPVWDRDVSAYLGGPSNTWTMFADAFRDEALVARLEEVRSDAGVQGVSLLRVLDVVMWRTAHGPESHTDD